MEMRKSQEHNSDRIHNVYGGVAGGISQGQNYSNETPQHPPLIHIFFSKRLRAQTYFFFGVR